MARTYRQLYRGKVEIISIGVGEGKIRLPRGVTLGIDTLLLGFLATLIIGLPVSRLVQLLVPHTKISSILVLVTPFACGILVAFTASKYDPHGKSVIRWLFDWLVFLVSFKRTDGWSTPKSVSRLRVDASWYAPKHTLPVQVKARKIMLHKPLAVRVHKRQGIVVIARHGNKVLPSGSYEIRDGELRLIADPPVIRRRTQQEEYK